MIKIIFYSLLFYIYSFASVNKPIVIKVSYEDKATYPYYIGEGKYINFKKPGLAIEVMKNIEKKLNVKFEFQREPGLRGQRKLQYDKIDMLLFASYKKEREKLGVYPKTKNGRIDTSKKAMQLSYYLYTLKKSKIKWDGKQFYNINGEVGATKGYSIISFLKKRGIKVSENPSNLGDPKKLIAHRIVAFANQSCKIDPFLKQHPNLAKKIKKIYPPLKSKPYYILFSHKFYKAYPKLANEIWNELRNLDRFKKIKQKY